MRTENIWNAFYERLRMFVGRRVARTKEETSARAVGPAPLERGQVGMPMPVVIVAAPVLLHEPNEAVVVGTLPQPRVPFTDGALSRGAGTV